MPSLMKGNTWHERKDAKDRKGNPIVKYPVIVEDKHDEIRCHVQVLNHPEAGIQAHFNSYAGNPLANMQRFAPVFVDLAAKSGYNEFDCGFEVNGNFNDSYRWVRSTKGLPPELENAPTAFYLFDLPESPVRYELRCVEVKRVAALGYLGTVSAFLCYSADAVETAFVAARARGKEGVMVKQLDHLYQRGKRTDGWLKMKPEDDADGIITALYEAVSEAGVPLGRIGSVQVVLADGSTAAPHGIAHGLGRDMFLNPNKYLTELCEFKFMERDRQGGYRHPVWHRLREA